MSELQFEVARLNFQAPLHISSGKENVFDVSGDILHSDQLKSALFAAGRQLYGDQIDRSFLTSFTISSAFPYYDEAYFFPKPMMKLPLQIEGVTGQSKLSKQLKKLQYLEKGWMEQIMATGENGSLKVEQNQLSPNNMFLWSSNERADNLIFTNEVQQRVSIPYDREQENPTPYYMDRIYFSENAGLFFMIQWAEDATDEQKKQVEAAFNLLGDNGVGTDRNVGNGHFFPEWSSVTFNVPEQADKMMATGLFCPEPTTMEEADLQDSAYQITERGGYIAGGQNPSYRHYRKKWVYMFTEGSVFPNGQGFTGQIVDLRPTQDENIQHPVWRDGSCIFLPLKAS